MTIAITGSGISGLSCALPLNPKEGVDVTLNGVSHPVDTGFLVHNPDTYINLISFLKYLNVKVIDSDMIFSVKLCERKIEWAGIDSTIFFLQKNIQAHYDLGNSFYELWRDPAMTYSSAIFKHVDESLEEAQRNKYQRIIDTVKTKATDHILEVCCGWGALATMAAVQMGCKVTCLTLSREQHQYATVLVKKLQQVHLLTTKICDYRDQVGGFDHIVSIEMLEALGAKYWEKYFNMIEAKLKPRVKAMLQSIYIVQDLFSGLRISTDFIQQYIFPRGMVLAPEVLKKYFVKNNPIIKDFYYFGLDYTHTLSLWRKEFKNKFEQVKSIGFDEAFLKI
ncbi:MAG: class I SAM-dependent methyltransferase [Bacteriovorax sp.]|nr:class I SAM-dependent methyltransferase [Bacteriovorax sp.]